jgi:hypothetical protein
MAVPVLDSRNLHRISTELGFLEQTLSLQPENKPEHLRAWAVLLHDMDKQWASLFYFIVSRGCHLLFLMMPPLILQSEYRGILKSVGFQDAPTGELLEREQRVLSRKKEAEMTYVRLRESVETFKGPDQPGSALEATGGVDYQAMVNDHTSTDAEGEPDTTASAPAIATEKPNGEKSQRKEVGSETRVKASPVPEVSAIAFSVIAVLTVRIGVKENDELQVGNSTSVQPKWS